MKKRKVYLFVMIFLFTFVIFAARFYDVNYGTRCQDDKSKSDLLSERNINNHKPRHILEEQIKDDNEKFAVPNKVITIAATGDIMFHTPQLNSAYDKATGEYEFYPVFKSVDPYISSVDLAIGNLETVVAGGRFTGYPTFNSPIEVLRAIKEAGFDILSTANNHSLDRGKHGVINTIDSIKSLDMENVGTYKEAGERVLIKDFDGFKLGFLAYTYGCNGLESLLTEEELDTMVNIIDETRIKRDIEMADSLGVDLTIVSIHWGNEYHLHPSQEQVSLGKKMVEWGADIILGSHPHVIQESEIIKHNGKDKFIIYSMGNFVSNQRRETLNIRNRIFTEDGIIVKLHLEKDFLNDEAIIKEIEYIPTWVNKYKDSGKYLYEILPTVEYLDKDNKELGEDVHAKIEASYIQTINKMSQ